MAYFNTKQIKTLPIPIPDTPGYIPPVPPIAPTPEGGSNAHINPKALTNSTTITLYYNMSENSQLNKSLTTYNSYNIAFKNSVSEMNPVIILEADNLSDVNYAYIAYTKRYYYITDKIMISNNIWEIHLKTDVLMSFKDGIRNSNGILVKTENSAYEQLDLNDGSFVNLERTFIEIKPFPNGFEPSPFNILITAGG